jgi:hypothetical protein
MKMYWKILSWWENNSQLGMLKQWRYSMSRKYYMKMYWWYAPSLDWWYHCRFSHQETFHLPPGHKIFTCLDQRNYSASYVLIVFREIGTLFLYYMSWVQAMPMVSYNFRPYFISFLWFLPHVEADPFRMVFHFHF